jgi:hypothetical protein
LRRDPALHRWVEALAPGLPEAFDQAAAQRDAEGPA